MARLSEEQIQKIWEVYAKVGTYVGTAKICGNSVSTVKKYVELGNKNTKNKEPKKERILFSGEIPPISQIKIPEKEFRGDWLCLSDKELIEIAELRKEI